jgi:hypothetical protein
VGLEVDTDDVEDLFQSHNRELTTEDLQELASFIEHNSGEEEQDQGNTMPTSETKEFLTAWDTEVTDVQTSSHRRNIAVNYSEVLRTEGLSVDEEVSTADNS